MKSEAFAPVEQPLDLDTRGILAGTDKSSISNDYLRHYERIFAPWRERTFFMWEIGVAKGASLLLWRDYFPNATIVGVDINPLCKQFEGPRIVVEIGSQDDPEFLLKLCATDHPAIIIDDGSHRADHILFTFERLFPHLLSGGIYVIEDLYLHFGETEQTYRGTATVAVPDIVKSYATRLMAARTDPAEAAGFSGYASRMIDHMEIFKRGVAFHKGGPKTTPDWKSLFSLVNQSPDPDSWHHLSTLIMWENGPLSLALDATRRGVALNPNHPAYRCRLAHLLQLNGQLDDAIAEAQVAVKLTNSSPQSAEWKLLESLRRLKSA
jgi:hypothetical protein